MLNVIMMNQPQLPDKAKEQSITIPIILGLGQRISNDAYNAVIADSAYADQLLQNRNRPEQLQQLLDNPSQK